MKRTVEVKGQNGSLKIRVVVNIESRALGRDEVENVASRAVRAIVKALADLPYSDFGVDNLEIRL